MMKKYFSNIFALAALLMAGAAFTACSSDDNSIEQPANPVGEKTYTLTINASKGANASTRALALDGTKLVASWENGDVLSVYNKTKEKALTGSLTAKNANGGKATFSGSLTGTIEVGDELHLFYHQPTGIDDYKAQTGTLASAAALDFAVAFVTVASVEGGEITISEPSASFLTQTAMLKLTLTDGTNKLNATQLKVSAAMTVASLPMTEDIATFTLPEATYTTNGDGILYFALPYKMNVAAALEDKIKAKVPEPYKSQVTIEAVMTALNGATLTYTATVGGNTYTATKTNGYTFAAGKYYAGTLTMAKPAPTAYTLAESTVGMIVGSDGKAYAAADKDNLPSGVTAVAMVAYKSTTAGKSLAIQLNSSPVSMNWNEAQAYTSYPTLPAGTGTWRLPSKEDWKDMIVSCAVSGDATELNGSNALDPINGFKAKIAATGITWQSTGYWSSTGSGGPMVWGVAVRLDENYAFFSDGIYYSEELAVLGCLAF